MTVQETIIAYIEQEPEVSDFTIRCFIGMIETGEATMNDFVTCGGLDVVKRMESQQCK